MIGSGRNEECVSLSEVPPLIVKAILAVEDERFTITTASIRLRSCVPTWVNLRSGGVVQGGSTLTQQLMKNFSSAMSANSAAR